jgi:hypothetical protein
MCRYFGTPAPNWLIVLGSEQDFVVAVARHDADYLWLHASLSNVEVEVESLSQPSNIAHSETGMPHFLSSERSLPSCPHRHSLSDPFCRYDATTVAAVSHLATADSSYSVQRRIPPPSNKSFLKKMLGIKKTVGHPPSLTLDVHSLR